MGMQMLFFFFGKCAGLIKMIKKIRLQSPGPVNRKKGVLARNQYFYDVDINDVILSVSLSDLRNCSADITVLHHFEFLLLHPSFICFLNVI